MQKLIKLECYIEEYRNQKILKNIEKIAELFYQAACNAAAVNV